MKRSLTFLFLLVALYTQGQPLTFGERKQIHSRILSEDREYMIYVPPLNVGEKPGLMVILDADINFSLAVAMQQFMTRGRVPMTNKNVIIGIINTNRTRDLTPSHVENKEGAVQRGGDYSQSGGAPSFMRFVTEELIPTATKGMQLSGLRTLVGHSFGGLACLFTALRNPQLFDSYVAVDPSVWWDRGLLIRMAEETTAESLESRRLYIGYSSEIGKDAGRLRALLQDTMRERLTTHIFGDETHGTVMLPALFDFMKHQTNTRH